MAKPDSLVTCEHASECGACALIGLPARQQLDTKRSMLLDALRAHDELRDAEVYATLRSPQAEGYRNRAKMGFESRGRGQVALGYFRPRSRALFDAPGCRVLVPEVLETTQRLRAVLAKPGVAPEGLRFVDVRCGSDPRRQHLTLVIGAREVPRLALAEIRRACPHVTGIGVNLNTSAGPQVLKGPVTPAWGERFVEVSLPDATLLVSAGSFFQVNLGMLPLIHERLADFLSGGRVLTDLYAGVGTHGLALHRLFERVSCIEGVSSAVRDARSSVEASRATNVTIVASPVEKSIGRLLVDGTDSVVMNPSREGVRAPVITGLAASRVTRLAYLSCEPRTLARDLALLVEEGFRVASVEPIDMMPQTGQVEALAFVEREVAKLHPIRERRIRKRRAKE